MNEGSPAPHKIYLVETSTPKKYTIDFANMPVAATVNSGAEVSIINAGFLSKLPANCIVKYH